MKSGKNSCGSAKIRRLAGLPVVLLLLFAPPIWAAPKTLRVACYPGYYPWSVIEPDGEAAGVLPGLWRLWSQKTGTPVTFVPLRLEESMEAVSSGRVDAHCGLFYTDARAKRLQFTDMILRMRTVLFVRSDIASSRISDQFPPVTVVQDDAAIDALKEKFPGRRLIIVRKGTHGLAGGHGTVVGTAQHGARHLVNGGCESWVQQQLPTGERLV